MRVDIGLTFITVATGLALESGDLLAASRTVDLAPAAPNDTGHSNHLRQASARGSGDVVAAGRDGPVAVIANLHALWHPTVVERFDVESHVLTSGATRRAHRPRGPPVR